MNDNNDIWGPAPSPQPSEAPREPAPSPRRATVGQNAKIAGALVIGGIAGAAILGPIATLAASPSPAASAPSTSGQAGTAADPENDRPGGPGGGHSEAVTDTSVVAKAVGISESDLLTALQGGQTVAQVAKAHNVNLQVVIDALVADGQSELDAAVKAGTLTQAQADAEKAELTQRATDQANGSFQGGGRH